MSERAPLSPSLVRVVSVRHAVPVLDALLARPRTGRELRHRVRTRKRDLAATLRTLASDGVIRRLQQNGSWDLLDLGCARYELTPVGLDLVRQLSRLEVWTALYEQYCQ